MMNRTALALVAGLGLSLLAGCSKPEEGPKLKPAYSGKKPNLPAVPSLPNKAKKDGDAYTVWGAIHDLRSDNHSKDFEGKEVTIVGYIVKTNFATACANEKQPGESEDPCVPACAVHKMGKEDPEGCLAPVPGFWIAESADEKDFKTKAIPVKGWASNMAALFSMAEEIDSKKEKATLMDSYGKQLPNPLPNVGAKVKIKGRYGVTANVTSKGAESNPRTGILELTGIEYVEPPKQHAFLPGQKLRNPDVGK